MCFVHLPAAASGAAGVAKCISAIRLPNVSGSGLPDIAMYSMIKYEPPLAPSS